MRKADEMLNEDEIDCCKEELKNYIEFMETVGDNAGWARGLRWYVDKLEKQLADSTPNLVIREKIEELKNTKTQLPVEHMRQAQIRILQEISKKGEK